MSMKYLALLLLSCSSIAFDLARAASFVKKQGNQLTIDGKPFYFLGTNAYWLQEMAKHNDKRWQVDKFFSYCQKYRLLVVRVWGFNHNVPKAKGVYSETEFQGYDYIVKSARDHGIRLIFALGNSWAAYRSPEDFMSMAGIDPKGKDLLDFYREPAVRAVYKDHIWNFVNRKNTLTGVAYRDDPTIMMWDTMNEPRCPGCIESWQQDIHHSWLQEMANFVRASAPSQLVAHGTEGYFMDKDNLKWNPGAGVKCEGEDWTAMLHMPNTDVAVAHIYDRQIEGIPPTWREPTFEDLMHFSYSYLDAHVKMSKSASMPLVVEEFNLLVPKFSEEQRTVLFQMFFDYLNWQKSVGGPLMGLMFWNGAFGSDVHDDGYNIYLDVPDYPQPKPQPQPATKPGSGSSAPAPSQQTTTPAPEPKRMEVVVSTETLGDFRRGPQRDACAQQEARTWLPEWDKPYTHQWVNIKELTSRTSGKRVQDIMKSTGQGLGW